MDVEALRGLFAEFQNLEDPRVERTRRHEFQDIMVIGVLITGNGRKRSMISAKKRITSRKGVPFSVGSAALKMTPAVPFAWRVARIYFKRRP